ncbi:hypothetical protein [Citrobacter freundii]|nr:hypothetical protein [Citrobacter freundii]
MKAQDKNDEEYVTIFRRWKKDPETGKILYPPKGCKAWPIKVKKSDLPQ